MIQILLIEQELLYQKAFRKMVERVDQCELVAVAESGLEAKECVEKYRPHLIFAEALVGGENGIDICCGLKTRFPELSTYILSSYANMKLIQNSMRAGVDGYLLKPLSNEELKKIVEENQVQSEEVEDEYFRNLVQIIDSKDYYEAYKNTRVYIEHIFQDVDVLERKNVLKTAATNLFYMVPGMDQAQKEYYFQKYELTNKVTYSIVLSYHWMIAIITEVFRQLCVMKYTHMNQVLQYIESNIHNEISLTELADLAGISSGYLSRIFKKYYKISVVDYIHLRKLATAKHYMATSEMNISDISFLLGYSEAGYFCKIFKKYENLTPSAYTSQYIKK